MFIGGINLELYYHATPYANLDSILDYGIQLSRDGLVYMCKSPEDAAKFLAIRGVKDILAIEVKVPKKLQNTIVETFDHSERFFRCRAFASTIPIPTNRFGKMTRYEL